MDNEHNKEHEIINEHLVTVMSSLPDDRRTYDDIMGVRKDQSSSTILRKSRQDLQTSLQNMAILMGTLHIRMT